MMDTEKRRQLQQLASLYCDGDLDEEGFAQLNQMLSDDRAAAEVYFGVTTTHSDLMLLRPVVSAAKSGTADQRSGQGNSGRERGKRPAPLRPPSSHWIRYGIAGLAASLATIVVYLSFIQPSGEPVSELPDAGQSSVARIIRKVDCDWENDRWAVVSSSEVNAGQTLSMSRGLMELEFSSGAIVTLEAPVTFTVESAMRGVLVRGKLTAQVPESAHGFTVNTPGCEAIDLGTEFGLFVGDDGVTETHVFQGEVVVRPIGSSGQDQELHLTDDMALRTGGDQDRTDPLAAVPARFTRLNFDEAKLKADSEPVRNVAVDRKLSLWLSADQRLQKDEKGRVSSWGDLCTTSNTTAQNAWQVDADKRPKWIEDGVGGRPVVRFGYKNVLVTEPIKLGSSQTISVVLRINETLLDKTGVGEIGRQIINMNGPPHMILGIDDQHKLFSRNYAGFRAGKDGQNGRHVSVGKTIVPDKLDEQPVVVVSVFDPEVNQSRLYLNGKLVANNTAPKLGSTEAPRYIGAHSFLPSSHFLGDIAELMVYDTGLTDAESLALSKSMMAKYQIRHAEQDAP